MAVNPLASVHERTLSMVAVRSAPSGVGNSGSQQQIQQEKQHQQQQQQQQSQISNAPVQSLMQSLDATSLAPSMVAGTSAGPTLPQPPEVPSTMTVRASVATSGSHLPRPLQEVQPYELQAEEGVQHG